MAAKISLAAPGIKAEPHLVQSFREEVASLLERNSLGFPGAQPVSFARRHLEELTKQDYYVCEKSDGIRYLLYCTRDTDGRELHYLIDRKNDYWYIEDIHLPIPGDETHQEYHTNTLIDGELVIDTTGNKKQAKYLVFDCLVLDGNSLMNRTLDKRIAYFQERIFTPYRELYKLYPDEIQYLPFIMEMKQMQFGYGIEMMFRQILPNLPHGNDGLIFTCRNSNYKHGTDPHILKWKPETENSVDFRLSLEFTLVQPDEVDRAEGITEPYYDYDSLPIFNLLVHASDSRDQWYGIMHVLPAEWKRMKALNEPLDDRIVECSMDSQKRWRFMRWRDDKANANHISTVESVIESITDRVTEHDLLGAAKRIRDEWKRRIANKESTSKGGSSVAGVVATTGANGLPVGLKRKAEEQHAARPSPGPNNALA